MTLVWLNI